MLYTCNPQCTRRTTLALVRGLCLNPVSFPHYIQMCLHTHTYTSYKKSISSPTHHCYTALRQLDHFHNTIIRPLPYIRSDICSIYGIVTYVYYRNFPCIDVTLLPRPSICRGNIIFPSALVQ